MIIYILFHVWNCGQNFAQTLQNFWLSQWCRSM